MSWYPKYIHAYYFQSFDLFPTRLYNFWDHGQSTWKKWKNPRKHSETDVPSVWRPFSATKEPLICQFLHTQLKFHSSPRENLPIPKRKRPFVGNESKTKTGKAGFNHQLNKYLYLAKDTGQFPKKLVSQFSFFRVYVRLLGCTLSFLPHKQFHHHLWFISPRCQLLIVPWAKVEDKLHRSGTTVRNCMTCLPKKCMLCLRACVWSQLERGWYEICFI